MELPITKKITEEQKAEIIINDVNDFFNVECRQKTRLRTVCEPRQIAQYLVYNYTRLNTVQTGKLFDKDHATVLHAQKVVKDLIQTDANFRNNFIAIKEITLPKIRKKDKKYFIISKISTILAKEPINKLEKIMEKYTFKKLLYYKSPEIDYDKETVELSVELDSRFLVASLDTKNNVFEFEYNNWDNENDNLSLEQQKEIFEHLEDTWESSLRSGDAFTFEDKQGFIDLIFE